jgi:hypothetical protein
MDEFDSRPLNGEDPAESVRRLLAEAERVSRELGARADEMVARAESSREDANRLVEELLAAVAKLAEEELVEEPAGAGSGPAAATERDGGPTGSGSDGARMLARQMLANGADPAAVERNLRSSFGVENADAVVDSILGADG